MPSEANTKRAQALIRPVGARRVVDILAVASELDAAEQRGREEERERWRKPPEPTRRQWSPAALAWLRDYAGSIDSTALLLAFGAGRESAEAELRRLRERIGRMVEREERYRLDATQRMDDLDAASHDRAALVLRSLLTAPQAREEG